MVCPRIGKKGGRKCQGTYRESTVTQRVIMETVLPVTLRRTVTSSEITSTVNNIDADLEWEFIASELSAELFNGQDISNQLRGVTRQSIDIFRIAESTTTSIETTGFRVNQTTASPCRSINQYETVTNILRIPNCNISKAWCSTRAISNIPRDK